MTAEITLPEKLRDVEPVRSVRTPASTSARCAVTFSRACPTTTTRFSGSNSRAAAST